MAFKVICGKSYFSSLQSLAKELGKNLSLDTTNYVIVPNGKALYIKNQIMKALDKDGIFNLKVLDFVTLAKQTAGFAQKYITDEQGLLIFKSILKKCKNNLKSFYKIVGNDSAERELYGVLAILAKSCVSPQNLKSAGVNLGGILGAKAEDIAELYEIYYKCLDGKFANNHILINNLVQNIKSGYFAGSNFFVYGFSTLSEEETRLINALGECGYNLYFYGIANPKGENKRIYPRFSEDICNKFNIKAEICEQYEVYTKDIELLLDNLFGFNNSANEQARNISIRCADTVCLEVKGVCREIRKEIVENNMRYKDIAVFCPDLKSYKGDIKRQFEIFEIPYCLQDEKELSSFAIAKLLIDGINAVKSNYEISKVLTFAKNILLDICAEDFNKFELYAIKYNLSANSFVSGFDIGSKDIFYERAKVVYDILSEKLSFFDCSAENISKIANMQELVSCVTGDIYTRYLNKLVVTDGTDVRQVAELAMRKINSILDNVVQMSSYSDNIDIYNSLIDIIKNTKIGISKRYVDNVLVTNDSMQIDKADILYIMGANDGVITSEKNNIGIFTYSDVERLANNGVHFKPNLYEQNYNAKFETLQLVSKGKKVVVSYNQAIGEPSLFVKNICELLDIKAVPFIQDNNKIDMDIGNYAMKIGTKSNAKAELSHYYSERMRGIVNGDERLFDYLYTRLEGEYSYQNIIKKKDFKFVKPNSLAWSKKNGKTFASISAVERYFDCPFKFFCEKTLGLTKVQKSGLDVLTVGTFIHRILEKFFRRYKNFDISEREINIIADSLCNESLAETEFESIGMSNSKTVLENSLFKKVKYILNKLVQIAKRTEFKTKNTELNFGFEYSDLPPYELKTEDNTYNIRGKIDRIDSYGDYIAIVDYKSKRSVSYGLKEVYYGERVQLLIYLNAYCSKIQCEPFALLYMPLPYSYSNEDASGVFAYSGLVRDLQGVFEHFDNKFNDKNISSLPIGITKDGNVSSKGLLSKDDLRILREYADKVVANAIQEIESGYIEAKPTNCDNCEFGLICLNKNNPKNKRVKYTASNFAVKGGDDNGKN